jgi:hypothetical protein
MTMFVRLVRFAGRVALVVAPTVSAIAQTPAPSHAGASHVHVTLRLSSGATQYRQSEPIQLQLQFTSDQPEQFEVSAQAQNRWGTAAMEEFHVTPAKGAVDPLASYENPFLNNERRFSPYAALFPLLVALPVTINLPLTDWLRFDRPGHYKLSLRTFRASSRPATPGEAGRALPLDTNEVEFDIIPADDAWQAQQLKELESQTPVNWPRLRALGTVAAARFLARQYRGDVNPLDHEALLGLLASPNRQAGVEEMGRLLRDPDFPVTTSFLDALAVLDTSPADATWPSIRARLPLLRRQLSEALPAKRGQALVTSRQTYMAGLEQLAATKFSTDQIIQIIQTFEQLSPNDQDLWLGQRWTQVSDQRWLPVLQRLAVRDVNFRQSGNPDLDPIVGISKLALKRRYELDPRTGREAILREISSPAPRFGADALGILPDQTLPAEQHIIAEHFASLAPPASVLSGPANRRPGTRQAAITAYEAAESHLASLLFRYADRDVVPEVLPAVKNRFAERNCDAQDKVLAFLLKVDPDEAGSLFRTIASDRPAGRASCLLTMYSQVGSLIASPVLERFAIESLDDDDLVIATEALRYLRDHGSAQAEQPIFDRLVRWNAKWRAHASDLARTAGQPNLNPGESSFGMELAQAMARGHGWLADKARIRQLLSIILEPNARMDLTAAISQIERKRIHVYYMGDTGSMFLVAQYQLESMDDLKNKLSQYPRGTVFVWSDHRSPTYDILDHQVSRDIAQWATAKDIHIEGL